MAKRISLKDIADELGVSITTVSRALRGSEGISPARRRQVLSLIEERNYVPNYMAQSLRKTHTSIISLVVTDNSNPYFAKVIKGVENTLYKEGYVTLIFNNDENPEKEIAMVKEMLAMNVAGVLITPAMGNTVSIELLRKNNVPYVIMNRYLEEGKDNYVVADDEMAGYIGTKYLLEHYQNEVIFINQGGEISTALNRLKGYERALAEHDFPIKQENIISGILSQEDAYLVFENLIKERNRSPVSVICYSDMLASGVLMCAIENGFKIPEEVAVMGIDAAEIYKYFYPGLSSVYIPKYDLGAKSAEILLSMIQKHRIIEREDWVDESDKPEMKEIRVAFKPELHLLGSA